MRIGVEDDAETGQIVRANRQRLRDWLRTHVDVQYDRRVVRVEEHGDKVTVHFEHGTSATGDILVGAEGSRSVIRRHILGGKDDIHPLPVGSLVGELELAGADFARQLELAHSAYIVIDDSAPVSLFAALNRVSPDGKVGYWYFILHWVDKEAVTVEKPYWTVSATKEEFAAFVKEKARHYPDHLRVLIDRTPVERYKKPGVVLQGVQLTAEQLPVGRVIVIGDAAHSMTPSEFGKLMREFRDDMLSRAARAISVSNPVPEQQAENQNREGSPVVKWQFPYPRRPLPSRNRLRMSMHADIVLIILKSPPASMDLDTRPQTEGV
ncbi:hypothetical protein DFH07DRAFT_916745 [Mycena maculata]|uniref:FAD-binding domain-containing protein n=1 Tax=Mycena maculata TaxID=230809 RepID=A0AAD7JGQ2_9AGAR|nr:hypothetical protein DFH07DRAFT_916745 [Mycena maculata]